MSSLHFEVENFGTWAEVRDKHSTNGTWLNNARVMSERLNDGDQIRAGITVFNVQLRGAEAKKSALKPALEEGLFSGPGARPPSLSSPRNSATVPPSPLSPRPTPLEQAPFTSSASGSELHSVERGSLPKRVRLETGASEPLDKKESELVLPGEGFPKKSPDSLPTKPGGKLNPIADSIDISSLKLGPDSEVIGKVQPPERVPPSIQEALANDKPRNSPISDSSLFLPDDSKSQVIGPSRDIEYQFLTKRLLLPAGEGLEATVERLARWSIQVVVHPIKIRQSLPASCPNAKYLWSCYGSGAEFGPIAIPWIDFKRVMLPQVGRLCASDGLVIFFGANLDQMAERLQQMPLSEVPGFSEAGGFLGCFWPSSLVTILASRGTRVCNSLFCKEISGLLMPSPYDDKVLIAAANSEIGQDLGEFGFIADNKIPH